jgi:uncharacterized protein
MHNARRIAESLERNGGIQFSESEKQILRFAALLHDVGHGPFSHFYERILREFEQKAHHETESVAKITGDLGLQKIFNDAGVDSSEVALLVSPDSKAKEEIEKRAGNWPTMAKIISGDIDADRMDYLVRDTFFTGFVPHIDLDFLINSLVFRSIDVGNKPVTDIFITSQGVVAADALLFARFLMRQHVWLNRMNRVAELLIYKAVQHASKISGSIFQDSERRARFFREGTDDDLLIELRNVDGFASQLMRDFDEGKLFNSYEEIRWGQIHPYYQEQISEIDKLGKDKRIRELSKLSSGIEQYLSEKLEVGENEILVDLPQLGIMPEANQKVLIGDNSYALLGDYSPLAANLNKLYRDYYVAFVFVRTSVDRKALRMAIRGSLGRN